MMDIITEIDSARLLGCRPATVPEGGSGRIGVGIQQNRGSKVFWEEGTLDSIGSSQAQGGGIDPVPWALCSPCPCSF